MTLNVADRVFETTTTQGTGTVNLSGPVQGFRSFASAFEDSDKIPYIISDDTDWEVGVGTLSEGSPDQLSRDTVYSSSNAGLLVNWGSGTRNVRCGPVADLIYHRTENKNVIIGKGSATGSGTLHTISMDVAPLAYEVGMEIVYACPSDVTGAVNVNVDTLGNQALKRNGQDLQAGDFLEDDLIKAYYNGTHFELLLPTRYSDVGVATGDGEWTHRSSAKSGWIFEQGQSLGDTSSGADLEGTAYQALYAFYWNNISNDHAPVSSGRGASASADWTAGKVLTIPDARDRAPFGAGSTWALGQTQGSDSIARENLPDETLSFTGTFSGSGTILTKSGTGSNGVENDDLADSRISRGLNTASTNNTVSLSVSGSVGGDTESLGDGVAFLPKGIGMNYMVKL